MPSYDNILVVCVDRDNDLGRKTGINGPVIGRKNNLNAAAKLALADPGEADANSMFAAVKKHDEIKTKAQKVEVATLTGVEKTGFESDKEINRQLDSVLENFMPDGVVFISDGADDEQMIPIIQSKVPIISKEIVIIKQAKEVEGTYYSIMEALKDPGIARIVFLMPGLVILLWGVLFFMGLERLFIQSMSIIIGVYLILKGTGIEDAIAKTINTVTKPISLQKVSFPFYIAAIVFFIIGIYGTIISMMQSKEENIVLLASVAGEQFINLATVSGISFILGRAIDSVQAKRAFLIRRYLLSGVAVVLLWFLLDTTRKVITGEPYAGLEYFVTNVLISFAAAFIAYRASGILEIRNKITKLLVGLSVYDKQGQWLGKVEEIQKEKKTIILRNAKTKEKTELAKERFYFKNGKIFLA